jgi:hypothetical protein
MRSVKIIATGWDNPTPQQLKRDQAEMEKRPFDGVVVEMTAEGQPQTVGSAPFRAAFGAGAWKEEWFARSITDLKSLKPARLRHLLLNLLANPGNVDWFDDTGWKDVVEHWRIAARVAKRGGMRGILFDPEPYTKPWSQFSWPAQPGRDKHSFDEYREKARERGRAVMIAVAGEYPDAVILSYFLLSYVMQGSRYLDQPDPVSGLVGQNYGLLPAFLDGWLDVAPSTIKIVDGDERAYTYNDEIDYLRSAVEIRGRAQVLVAPENRAKYRAQVQAGFAFYLDAYTNPPSSPYYVGPKGGTRLGRFRENLASAVAATDEYIWVYGEQGRWWPLPGGTAAWNKEDSYPGWKEDSAEWPARFPGCDREIACARDPAGMVREAIEELRKAGKLEDLARNGGFGGKGGKGGGKGADWKESDAPPGWSSWQDDGSHGVFSWDRKEGATVPGSARARGVAQGCFIQTYQVNPGDRYVIEVFCRNRGAGEASAGRASLATGAGRPWVTARWKDVAGKWTETNRDVPGFPDGTGTGTWKRWSLTVTVPERARELVLLLGVTGQFRKEDAAWFDDVAVYPLR